MNQTLEPDCSYSNSVFCFLLRSCNNCPELHILEMAIYPTNECTFGPCQLLHHPHAAAATQLVAVCRTTKSGPPDAECRGAYCICGGIAAFPQDMCASECPTWQDNQPAPEPEVVTLDKGSGWLGSNKSTDLVSKMANLLLARITRTCAKHEEPCPSAAF